MTATKLFRLAALTALTGAWLSTSVAAATQTAADPMATEAVAPAEDTVATSSATPAPNPCPVKKKKKGPGLGGFLKAAKKTGLTNIVTGGLLGQSGAVAGAVAGTAVELGTEAAQKPAEAAPAC